MSNAQEVVKLYRIESWDCQGTCETAICLRDTQRLGHGAVASQSYQEHVRNLGCRARARERASERARERELFKEFKEFTPLKQTQRKFSNFYFLLHMRAKDSPL